MREMVLNHASLYDFTRNEAPAHTKELAMGMARLVDNCVSASCLRTTKPLQEIRCVDHFSFFDVLLSLQTIGAIEEFRFLSRLTTKTPILEDMDEEIKSRFLMCQETTLPEEDGMPLLLCALTDWIAVGFPKHPWDCDVISVQFQELLPNDSIQDEDECVDNLTRLEHAFCIIDRHTENVRVALDLQSIWEYKHRAFPCLLFSPDVKEQLNRINPGYAHTIIRRLSDLDSSVKVWKTKGGATPQWKCKVTGEGENVHSDPKLRKERKFRSRSGGSEYFFLMPVMEAVVEYIYA